MQLKLLLTLFYHSCLRLQIFTLIASSQVTEHENLDEKTDQETGLYY